ncbi:MAG: Sua5/YciO/YrdC/YwlC family protein [Pseudomonadota bacterium]|nr:Sua5/YciO/YrdC/YwlC family protein [Pseudomonadota bacterium]
MNEFSDPKEASSWLKRGKILIHPTEGVWGLGCDAFNLKACQKINSLKKRENEKNFIILVPTISAALKCFEPISDEQGIFLNKIWPGHTTVIHHANKEIPSTLKALDNTIAVRVSNHLPLLNLLTTTKKPMVSTSANITKVPTPDALVDVIKYFHDPDVAVYAHSNGSAKKPSAIVRLQTMEYIRE